MKKNILFFCLSMLAVWQMPTAQNYNLALRSTFEFPGKALANLWGYTQQGREYALVGHTQGLSIIEVTNPDQPHLIKEITGPPSTWREVKTWQHYAYITTEAGPVQIVDLSSLPSEDLEIAVYAGDGLIQDQIKNVHALQVDEKKGFLYLYGSWAGVNGGGGALVFDIKPDPMKPIFVGEFQSLGYIHDGYADNDTLYGAHIYAGLLSVVDMRDKTQPKILGSITTPGAFTHNTWLSSDRKTIFTTDENSGSFLTAYDVSDPTNIVELDRIQATPGSGSIVHNTYLLGKYAVNSWYADGVTIVDAHRPDNLVQVAWYDTYPEASGSGYIGCWGVYPYFPSGNIIASNIPEAFALNKPGKMFVLTPHYKRACYLEGKVINGFTGQPLFDVEVTVNSSDPLVNTRTNLAGEFKTGQVQAGIFNVTFYKDGFSKKLSTVELKNGEVTKLEVELFPTSNTGFFSPTEAGIRVFPSPVHGSRSYAEVFLPEEIRQGEIRLFHPDGRQVWHSPVRGGQSLVPLPADLSPGVWLLSLYAAGRITPAVKFVKIE